MTSRRPGAHPHATRLVHLGRKAPDSKACARGPWSARSFPFTPTSQPRRLVSALQPWLPCRSVSPFPWSAPSRARRATCAPRRFPPARPVSPWCRLPRRARPQPTSRARRSRHRRRAQIERTRGVPWTPSRSRNASRCASTRPPGSDRTPDPPLLSHKYPPPIYVFSANSARAVTPKRALERECARASFRIRVLECNESESRLSAPHSARALRGMRSARSS